MVTGVALLIVVATAAGGGRGKLLPQHVLALPEPLSKDGPGHGAFPLLFRGQGIILQVSTQPARLKPHSQSMTSRLTVKRGKCGEASRAREARETCR